jgi:hypothetical protein
MTVDMTTTDLVEVTVMYMVPDTLFVVPFGKSGVAFWLNRPKVAFVEMEELVFELPAVGPGIKELIVACPGTYDIANRVVTFVVTKLGSAGELMLGSFVVAGGTVVIVLLVLAERVSAAKVVELIEELMKALVARAMDMVALISLVPVVELLGVRVMLTAVYEKTKYLSVVVLPIPALTDITPVRVVAIVVV